MGGSPLAPRLAAAASRLAALEAKGAAAQEPALVAYVRVLLARTPALPDATATVLAARIDARIAEVEARLGRARHDARAAVQGFAATGLTDAHLTEWAQRGRFTDVAQAARRLTRALTRPPLRATTRVPPSAFTQAAAQAKALVAVARADDDLPEVVGPYNALVLAVRTLRALAKASPSLLAAHVGRLSDLSALLALPEARETKRAAQAAPRRRRGR